MGWPLDPRSWWSDAESTPVAQWLDRWSESTRWWLDPARVGAFSITPYLYGVFVVVIPNLIFIGALLMLLAALTRSMLMVYLGVIGFFVLWSFAGYLTRDINNDVVAALVDPFGLRAMGRMTRYWTLAERNVQLPAITGMLLWNRLLWIGIGLALMSLTVALFQPVRSGTGRRWFGRAPKAAVDSAVAAPGASAPGQDLAKSTRATQRFDAGATWRQFLAQWRFDTKGVLKGVAFGVMLAFGVFNLVGSIALSDVLFGTKLLPVTHAGELIWKERAAGLGEVNDAMPVPDWVPLAAKLATVLLVTVAFMAAGVATCVVFQTFKGYTDYEWSLYLEGALIELIPFVLLGTLALVLQVLSHNKFLGYLLLIVALVVRGFMGGLNFEHNLYNYASAPQIPYSDMNGYGHFLRGFLWFEGYWSLFAALLVGIAALFWVRGTAPTLRGRWREAGQRARGPAGFALAATLLAFAGTGAFIYYNTNVLNRYVPGDVALDRQAKYEQTYRQSESKRALDTK